VLLMMVHPCRALRMSDMLQSIAETLVLCCGKLGSHVCCCWHSLLQRVWMWAVIMPSWAVMLGHGCGRRSVSEC
jgi:hypothetical protein